MKRAILIHVLVRVVETEVYYWPQRLSLPYFSFFKLLPPTITNEQLSVYATRDEKRGAWSNDDVHYERARS